MDMDKPPEKPELNLPSNEVVTKIPIKINYIIYSKVASVREEFAPIREIGNEQGELVKVKGPSLGWFVAFEGSREALHFGYEKPPIEVGEEFKITFEKVHHAKPSGPSK